ncbi:MAG: leucine-rich repeat protein [Prevotella sp.]|nr:leucine-rich repeat protein [Prevotella sp.]
MLNSLSEGCPASINYNGISYPIVRIYKDALYYNKNIKKIIIEDSEQPLIVDKNALPNDITSLYIGRNIEDTDIFSNNPYLKELTFGPNFTTVNSRMFYNCTAIECISTQNVQTIGDKAFATAINLTILLLAIRFQVWAVQLFKIHLSSILMLKT